MAATVITTTAIEVMVITAMIGDLIIMTIIIIMVDIEPIHTVVEWLLVIIVTSTSVLV